MAKEMSEIEKILDEENSEPITLYDENNKPNNNDDNNGGG